MAREGGRSLESIDWRLWLFLALLIGGGVLLVIDVTPVVLNWETASEVGTAGFNVHRAPVGDSDDDALEMAFERVNSDLIVAQGDEVAGATYRYEDRTASPGRQYQYRIEEVEWDGRSTLYPEVVVVRAGLSKRWVRLQGAALLLIAFISLWRLLRRPGRTALA